MLTSVIAQTSSPMTFQVENADPDEILLIKSISGLSQAKATLFMGDFARAGGYYQGRRPDRRNPVLNFKINPNYKLDIEASDIRELLYRTFMEPLPGSDGVQVLVKDDRRPDRYFIGYCESVEADIFEKELSATVSMLCTDPYLRSVEEVHQSHPNGWYTVPFQYEGSADTGIEVTLKVLAPTTAINLVTSTQTMTFAGQFAVGDILKVNTNHGSRQVLHNGVDAMARLSSTSSWLEIREPEYFLKSYGSTANDGRVVITDYRYRAAWWGI